MKKFAYLPRAVEPVLADVRRLRKGQDEARHASDVHSPDRTLKRRLRRRLTRTSPRLPLLLPLLTRCSRR